jgi:hypothetical protein
LLVESPKKKWPTKKKNKKPSTTTEIQVAYQSTDSSG